VAVAASGTVDRDGFKLEWVREGSGLPMMVVGSRSFYPRYFPQRLRDHFEIVFCDLRQWVATPDGFDVTTMTRDTFSEDIDALREAVGFEGPIVAGQSQNGSLALEYARHSPQSVRGVAAIAAWPPPGSRDRLESAEDFFERDADAGRKAEHERRKAGGGPASIETTQDFIAAFTSDDAQRWYDYTFDASALWEGVEVNIQGVSQVFSPAVLGGYRVQPLDVPVFLALGRYDYRWPYYVWDGPKRNFSNLTYRLYEKSAHHPPYEQPDEFVADIVEWAGTL
jgi:proline iminopeptidase